MREPITITALFDGLRLLCRGIEEFGAALGMLVGLRSRMQVGAAS